MSNAGDSKGTIAFDFVYKLINEYLTVTLVYIHLIKYQIETRILILKQQQYLENVNKYFQTRTFSTISKSYKNSQSSSFNKK